MGMLKFERDTLEMPINLQVETLSRQLSVQVQVKGEDWLMTPA